MNAERELDVVVYRATGFVGVLTAEYVAEHADQARAPDLLATQVWNELRPRPGIREWWWNFPPIEVEVPVGWRDLATPHSAVARTEP